MQSLTEKTLHVDPYRQFADWYRRAQRFLGPDPAQTMILSTVDTKGFPDARAVLLKGYDPKGYVFYTNSRSPKGRALLRTKRAALTFFWPALKRQIRIQGKTTLVTLREANAYFRTRPRLSQLGAWASDQSAPLLSRDLLDKRLAALIQKYKGRPVPRPPHWTGFRVLPFKYEFWQARPNRLHDRFLYLKNFRGLWIIKRLYP